MRSTRAPAKPRAANSRAAAARMRSGETRAGRGIQTNWLVNLKSRRLAVRLHWRPMKIVIAGGSGFLGRPLAAALAADHHDVVTLTRGDGPRRGQTRSRAVPWTTDGTAGPWAAEIAGAGAVVNLAGESIAGRRWTAAQKQRILESRLMATRSLAAAIHSAEAPPPVFVSGSAVGYYGPRGDEAVSEETPAGGDFLAEVCRQWEAEAMRAASARTRVACI